MLELTISSDPDEEVFSLSEEFLISLCKHRKQGKKRCVCYI